MSLNKLPSYFTSSTPSHIPFPVLTPPQVVYYIFAMVGMELFKGKIKYFGEGSDDPTKLFCGNVLLNGTSFAQLNYCKNNFNDVLSSFILLVELTVVNQWHNILYLFCEEPVNEGSVGFAGFLCSNQQGVVKVSAY